jgi:hypothetical protein
MSGPTQHRLRSIAKMIKKRVKKRQQKKLIYQKQKRGDDSKKAKTEKTAHLSAMGAGSS